MPSHEEQEAAIRRGKRAAPRKWFAAVTEEMLAKDMTPLCVVAVEDGLGAEKEGGPETLVITCLRGPEGELRRVLAKIV